MTQTKGRYLVGMLAAFVLLLGACQPVATPASDAEASAEPKTFVYAAIREWRSLEAFNAYDELQAPGLRNVIEVLLDRDPVTNELIPELATSFEPLDELTWRFTVREGVTFHDGSPLNAEAVAYAINHQWGEENAFSVRGFMGPQITAEAVDEFTVHVMTASPDPILPNRMHIQGVSSMRQLLEEPDQYPLVPIGTGPYKFKEFRAGDAFILEANHDWWGLDPDQGARGAINFDELVFLYRAEDAVRLAQVKTGEADIAQWISAESCQEAEASDGIGCRSQVSVETLWMRMDLEPPREGTAFGDQRVRLAFQLAVDYDTIVDTILGGQATIARQMVGPSAAGYNESLEPYGYDPERAKQLLDEAAADGVPVYETEFVNASLSGWFARSEELHQAVNGYLQDVGIDVVLEVSELDPFLEKVGVRPPPGRGRYFYVGPHGNELYDFALSLSGHLSCGSPFAAGCFPELDEMAAAAGPLTGAERDQALKEIAQFVHDQVYAGAVAHLDLSYAVNDCLSWDVPLGHRSLAKDMDNTCD